MFQRVIRVRTRHNRLIATFQHSLIRHPAELPNPISTRFFSRANRNTNTFIFSRINRQTNQHNRHRHSSNSTRFISFSTMGRAGISSISTRFQISSLIRNFFRIDYHNASSVISNFRQGIIVLQLKTSTHINVVTTTTGILPIFFKFLIRQFTILRPFNRIQVRRSTANHILVITRNLNRKVRSQHLQFKCRNITRYLSGLLVSITYVY